MSNPNRQEDPPSRLRRKLKESAGEQVDYDRRRVQPQDMKSADYRVDLPFSGPEPVYPIQKSGDGPNMNSPPVSPSLPAGAAPGKRSKFGDIFAKKLPRSGDRQSSNPSPSPAVPGGSKGAGIRSSLGKILQRDSDEEDNFEWDREDDLEEGQIEDDKPTKTKEMKKRERIARRTRCALVLNWIGSFPFFVRSILYIIAGNAVILTPGLIDFFFFAKSFYTLDPSEQFIDPGNTAGRFERMRSPASILGITLLHWSIFFAIVWTLFFLIRLGIRFLPNFTLKVIEVIFGSYGSSTKHVIDYISHLHGYITLAVWMVAIYTTFKAFFTPIFWRYHEARTPENINSAGPLQLTADRSLGSLAVCMCLLALEKLLVQIIAVRFHRRAYKDRIRENKFAAQVLEKLNNHRKNSRFSKSSSFNSYHSTKIGSAAEESSTGTSFKSGSGYNSDQSEDGTVMESKKKSAKSAKAKHVVQGISDFVVGNLETDWNIAHLDSKEEARRLARKLWEAYCPPTRKELTVEDFRGAFDSEKELRDAFAIFDKNRNGDIAKSEVKAGVLAVYHEKKVIEKSLRSVNSAVGKLDYVFLSVLSFICTLVFFSFFQVSTEQFLTSLGSLLLAATFMFGGTAQTLFESTIFLFVTHPYDVGDRVDVESHKFIVQDIGLLTTVFRGVDGKEYYAPNILLSTKFIHNIRRSGNQSSTIVVEVDPNTSGEQVQQFREKLYAFLNKEHNREFSGKVEVVVDDIKDSSVLSLKIIVEHRSNWQDGPKTRSRNSRLYLEIRNVIRELNISYTDSQLAHTDNGDSTAPPTFVSNVSKPDAQAAPAQLFL